MSGSRRRRVAAALIAIFAVIAIVFCCITYLGNSVKGGAGPDIVSSYLYPLKYTDEISDSAARHEVNPYWVCAIIKAESDWDSSAESSAGAVGLMQVQEETARDMAEMGIVDGERYPVEDLTDPATNIEYGTAYLRYLVERYHEMEPAIAAYNAGPGTVDTWLAEDPDVRESIDYEETKTYLLRVESYKKIYEEKYPDSFTG